MKLSMVEKINQQNGLSDLIQQKTLPVEKPKQENFGDMLKTMVENVNELQHNASDVEKQFLRGEISDVHQVMIAAEEASIAFNLLLEVRNKLVDSYKQLMRMNT